jgi:hypothetical protein
MYASTEVTDYRGDSFHKKLMRVFSQFSKYHINNVISFRYKVRASVIFKLILGNESLHKINNKIMTL